MIKFNCDYHEGAHPRIMDALVRTNMEQTIGYGEDEYCEAAREAIKKACQCEEAAVHFLVGGTQANLTVISSILRPHQAVLCVKEGHINAHETGAIEATGHKAMVIPGKDGKMNGDAIREAYQLHWNDGAHEHITQPKMVYISNPTELGTLYTKAELADMRKACDECGFYLFLDGARLGYGLMAEGNDLTLEYIAEVCDVFYIGGTKVGALFGEAVVISNPDLKADFRYLIKQRGGMLAKGRLLGIQYDVLMEDDLYFAISRQAVKLADQIRDTLEALNVPMLVSGITNQIFPILPDKVLDKLAEKYIFCEQERVDESHRAIRFCTSWATKQENVDALCADLKALISG